MWFRRRGVFVRRDAAQVLNALRVDVNFDAGLGGESLQLFDDASLGTVTAVQKGGNYGNTH
jgi:hypothetical protein